MSATGNSGLGRGTALAAGLITLAAATAAGCSKQPSGDGTATAYEQTFGGAFRLVDTGKRIVTDQTLRGKPYAMFFGYTRCPDVCPTTMNRMAQLRKQLGSDSDKFNLVFVSVDPEHDKPEDIGSFLSMFPTPVIGLTGSEAELKKIEKGFGVYVARTPLPNGDYTIDHTATVYLMGSRGQFVSTLDTQEPDGTAVAKLRRLIVS